MTHGYMMVTDLQGVKEVNPRTKRIRYLLTDPAVHCAVNGRFSFCDSGGNANEVSTSYNAARNLAAAKGWLEAVDSSGRIVDPEEPHKIDAWRWRSPSPGW